VIRLLFCAFLTLVESIRMYSIIENNPSFIMVYKKPGIDFHHQGDTQGLFESVKAAENCSELYPVHRLDKVTSGLLVMAKTAAANRELSAQFAARQVHKFYLAISQKKPKKKQGLIKGDMERTRRSAWKLLTTRINPAVTQFISEPMGQGRRLFLIKPHTGKTHQIRVALKSLGAPILGDILYGDSTVNAAVDRVYLHAYALSFSLDKKIYAYQVMPQEGHYFTDESFLAAVAAFHHPQQLTWPGV
jgi:tRNA pseudouridine32 synthase/23S rRNA pseudouridine746 synthase